MKIKVFQIDVNKDVDRVKFEGYKQTIEWAGKFDASIYEEVYEADAPVNTADDVYYMLNVGEKPDGYKGHSLSVSDVVEMNGKYMFCDSFGWRNVTDEWVRQEVECNA